MSKKILCPKLHITGECLSDESNTLKLSVSLEGNFEIITSMLIGSAERDNIIFKAIIAAAYYLRQAPEIEVVDDAINEFAKSMTTDMSESEKEKLTALLMQNMPKSQGDA
tara:strand:+ start:3469 stop:3798 length:330 start_codon:yes stop_codon:yes gene_type:complete